MSMENIEQWEAQISCLENEIGFAEDELREAEDQVKLLTQDLADYKSEIAGLNRKINAESNE